jgi:Sec-independent protein translocase protein TatA
MELLGIGPLELLTIFIIILIVLGPKDMVKAGQTIGRFLRQIVMSDAWRSMQQMGREIRTLPNKLMRQAGIENLELDKDLQRMSTDLKTDLAPWVTSPGETPPVNGEEEPPTTSAPPPSADPITDIEPVDQPSTTTPPPTESPEPE